MRSGLLVTWVGMQPLGPETLPEENANTFQALIMQTDNGTFANFIYKNIGWTQGARVSGSFPSISPKQNEHWLAC